jgi:hypothetical protein
MTRVYRVRQARVQDATAAGHRHRLWIAEYQVTLFGFRLW